MPPDEVLYLALTAFALLALPASFGLTRRAAAYGRHAAPGTSGVPSRLAWIAMELPSAISFAIVSGGPPRAWTAGTVLWCLWVVHYVHRGLIYPLRIRSTRRVPTWIVASAALFTTINGSLMGASLCLIGPELGQASLVHPRVGGGLVLFVLGMWANIDSDRRLLRTPRAPDGGYQMPKGGLFRFVSAPNYAGEIIEWLGWMIATGCSAALVFLIWTLANLVPRARSHHAWCRRTWPSYPRERTALVPRLLGAVLMLGAAGLSSGCGAHASVRAGVDIAAPPAVVWRVLRDLPSYREWNPFTTQVDGTLGPDAGLVLHVALRAGKKERLQKQHVVTYVEGERIVWQTRVGGPGMLRAERVQQIRALEGGGTRYDTVDEYTGGLVPLVMRLHRRDLDRGFAAMLHALKERAEAVARQSP